MNICITLYLTLLDIIIFLDFIKMLKKTSKFAINEIFIKKLEFCKYI